MTGPGLFIAILRPYGCHGNPALCFSSLWWEWVGNLGRSEALNWEQQPHQVLQGT